VLQGRTDLIQALDSSAPRVQRAAEELLISVGSEVSNDLVKVGNDARRRGAALRILRQATVSNEVVNGVGSESRNPALALGTRIHACELLGALAVKNDAALTQLGGLMSDQEPLVRIEAIEEITGLGYRRGSRLVAELTKRLDDPVPAVREAACTALGSMGPSAVEARTALEQLGKWPNSQLAQLARIAVAAITSPSKPGHP
jgi:HEAT repeat protein